MMMAMVRLDIPSVFLYGGSILPGRYKERDVTVLDVFDEVGSYAAGNMTLDELTALGREQSRARTVACNLSVDKITRTVKKSFETTTSQARAVTPEKPMLPPLSMYSMNVFNDDELVPLPIQDFSDSRLNNDNVTADDMMTFISELDEALGEVTQLASV
jgi:hypothetical protein